MTIEFENILKATEDMLELVRNWRNSKHVSQYMYTNHYITKEEHQQWIKKLRTKNTAKAWIIIYDERPAGLVSLSNIDYKNKNAEWGFYIAEESARGKGIGSATLYKLMEYVFDEMKFKKMSTMVLENNPGALELYEKFGFKKEGTLKERLVRDGERINIFLMGISADEWRNIKGRYTIKESIGKYE